MLSAVIGAVPETLTKRNKARRHTHALEDLKIDLIQPDILSPRYTMLPMIDIETSTPAAAGNGQTMSPMNDIDEFPTASNQLITNSTLFRKVLTFLYKYREIT
jgi:hypothetical protein